VPASHLRGLGTVVGIAVACLTAIAPLPAAAQNRLVDPTLLRSGPRDDTIRREFYFTRAVYTAFRPGNWTVDYPKADRQFMIGLKRLTNIDASGLENPVRLDDPALRRYPILYMVEPGYLYLTEAERTGLREYLLAGGFLIADDFWGTAEWRNFADQIRHVLPEYRIVDLPLDHPVFHVFYDLTEIVQVPNVGLGRAGGRTFEKDGVDPAVRGISDEKGRLLVAIVWNSDLGDAWEWAEDPYYPIRFSNFAYQLGVNLIVYAMSH